MSNSTKDQRVNSENRDTRAILNKFEITALNPMQEEAFKAVEENSDVVLLSPTGTGKTLAFLLPLVEKLDPDCQEIQILILVPSRELAQQIEQVARKMGSGYKVNAVYGGRAGSQDKADLKHRPAILIGTPGRIADRLRRDSFPLQNIKTLVLDEFDKSLEIGFELELTEILDTLPNVQQRILTSATMGAAIPKFVGLRKPVSINYLKEGDSQLAIKTIISPEKDKLTTLRTAMAFIGDQPGIIFCNFKESIARVSNYLSENDIHHECYHGGMEQLDRERALIKFRNGTNQVLLATDLAARGLDIPEIKFILHYQLPPHLKEFTHRNGRTARMYRDGTAYILQWKDEKLPGYLQEIDPPSLNAEDIEIADTPSSIQWKTLHISGGRRDKISKGDVAGLFLKQGQIQKEQLGLIELQQSSIYVGVQADIAEKLILRINNSRLKKKKVRITLV